MFICDISVLNRYGKLKLDEMLFSLKVDWRELVVMLVLEQVPGISQARLIPFLQTDKANVTKLLQIMEKKELVSREVDEQDQRNKLCYLTSQGKELVPDLNNILNSWEAASFEGISEEDLMQYQRISERIIQNLLKHEELRTTNYEK